MLKFNTMIDKIIDIIMTIASGMIAFGVFELLRNIKPKDNGNNKKS